MFAEQFQTFIMQEQPHVLRYVALGVGIAIAAGLAGYFLHRRSKNTQKPVKKA